MPLRRLCFIGASNVEGVGDEERRGWAGRLTMMPPAAGTGVGFYNLGIGGETTDMIRARWKGECRARIADDMEGAIVASFGLNDAAEIVGKGLRLPIEKTIENVTAAARDMAAWKTTIWIGPTPVAEDMMPMQRPDGSQTRHENTRLAALDETYAGIAGDLGIPYMSLLPALLDNQAYTAALRRRDGIHPAGSGYQIIADMIAAWRPWRALFD